MVTWPIARAVLVTAFLCAVAGYFLIRRRENAPGGTPSRHPCQDMRPGHPDRGVSLTFAQEQALAATEGQFASERKQPLCPG